MSSEPKDVQVGDVNELISAVPTTADIDVAISVKNLSKVYNVYANPTDRLKQIMWPGNRQFYKEFGALSDINFSVGRGETVGIIGRNGSGKSTLLQMICQTLTPSSGEVKIRGRLAALLELGAGFNPEFTGKENVYLNATILGMSRAEIDSRYESIKEFADLGDFIDQPVKTYSSGMYVRLAFATAINTDPDILVVDEALSVGDEAFQRKCFARIEQIQQRGGTILFVSHAASSILQLCTRAILLDAGEKILEGSPKFVVNHYQRLMNLSGEDALTVRNEIKQLGTSQNSESSSASVELSEGDKVEEEEISLESYNPSLIPQSTVNYESQGANIIEPRIVNGAGRQVNVLQMGNEYRYVYSVKFDVTAQKVGFGMLIKTLGGLEIAGGTTSRTKLLLTESVFPGNVVEVSFPFTCNLVPGTYFCNSGVSGELNGDRQFLHRILDAVMFQVAVESEIYATGVVDILNDIPSVVKLEG